MDVYRKIITSLYKNDYAKCFQILCDTVDKQTHLLNTQTRMIEHLEKRINILEKQYKLNNIVLEPALEKYGEANALDLGEMLKESLEKNSPED